MYEIELIDKTELLKKINELIMSIKDYMNIM